LRALPPPLDIVTVPERFSPSSASQGQECKLRALLASQRDAPRLSAHPAAALGTVFHLLLERAVRGQIPRSGGQLADDVKRDLERLLASEKTKLIQQPETSAYADLVSTLPPLVWRRKLRAVLDVACMLARSESRPTDVSEPAERRPLSLDDLGHYGERAEVTIEVPELRLRGRVDIIEIQPGEVIIRDLKSGRVQDRDGLILPHIEHQLQLYGLMVKTLAPQVTVRLIVNDGIERVINFDDSIMVARREEVRMLCELLPAGMHIPAYDLATTGGWCALCPHRHVCSRYLQWAPRMWRDGAPHALPLDTWGAIETMASSWDGWTVTLLDASGRRVRIFGLDDHLPWSTLIEEDTLAFFGLKAHGDAVHGIRWLHPLNFYERSPHAARDRAWSLEVFASSEVVARLS
jgi:RecB family exonuclease